MHPFLDDADPEDIAGEEDLAGLCEYLLASTEDVQVMHVLTFAAGG